MVVITGASGLLGSIIAEAFASKGVSVTALYNDTPPPTSAQNIQWIKCDVTDTSALLKTFKGVYAVVHAAAIVSFARNQRDKMFAVNVTGTANVVNACLENGVQRLVHISSVAAIGRPPLEKLIKESTPWTHRSKPTYYGESKHLAELEVFRGEAEGLSVASINPSIILSAAHHNRSSGKIIQYIKNERPFYVDGSMNFVDARDVAEMAWLLYSNEKITGRFIASAGVVEWKELFMQLSKRLGKKAPSIRVSPGLARIVALLESIRCSITGGNPIVTKETAKIARQTIVYSNARAIADLGMQFRPLQDTLDWCCSEASV